MGGSIFHRGYICTWTGSLNQDLMFRTNALKISRRPPRYNVAICYSVGVLVSRVSCVLEGLVAFAGGIGTPMAR